MKCTCTTCTRRISQHKSRITCNLCSGSFHPKCANLNPTDIAHMQSLNILHMWTCYGCNIKILPNFLLDISQDKSECKSSTAESPVSNGRSREQCATCHKVGNSVHLVTCDVCNLKSHKRCFAGLFGCKSCARYIIPGYDVNNNELFCITGNNNARFNPFDSECDLNNLGFTNVFDNNEEQEDWSFCSHLLNNCNYIEPSEIKQGRDSEIKIFSLNIRSLKDKIPTIIENIDHFSKFDVLCFNETNCSILKLPFGGRELELASFHPPIIQSPARNSSRGGGLVIYLNKKFCSINDYKILSSISSNSNPSQGEFLFIEITRRGKNIIIGNMYRSPSFDPNSFLDQLDSKLEILRRHKNKQIILVADNNIDLLKFQQFEPANKLVNTFSEHGFIPVISIPTRITSHSATLIDHIFVNSGVAVTKSGVISEDISDHLATYVNILIDPNKASKMCDTLDRMNNYRPINEESLTNFKCDMNNVNWDFLNNIDSADDQFTQFESKYHEIYEKNFPKKSPKKRKRKCDKPWILPWLQGACDRKNRFYKEYVKHPTISNKHKYVKIKKFVEKHIKIAKQKYYKNYFQQYCNDGRKKWQMINNLLNRNTKSSIGITKIINEDNVLTNPKDIAKTFNNYFCTIAQKLKDGDQGTGTLDSGRTPEHKMSRATRNLASMTDFACTDIEIENYINSLKNKATSDFAIRPLKVVNNIISPILNHIISASLLQGVFPSRLKFAKVIPIHKGGLRTDVSNYRPISLLSCFSKIYEKAMHYRLTTFLNRYNIISSSQYGFRAGHSCEHALIDAQSRIATALGRKQIALLLLIDFSKAFDMVDHGILLNKLEHYGVRQHHLSWFKTYLTNRQQYVQLNNQNSEQLTLKYSVPQGSILGPLLFIIYINDLPLVSKLASYIFYADDANIIVTANDITELANKINTVLQSINVWVTGNGLKLNLGKTKYMIFTNRHNVERDLNLTLNGTKIEYTEQARFLGVIVDNKLSWGAHINLLSAKLSRNAGIIYRLKGLVPQSILKTLYDSFIQSHLNYCSSVWGLGSKSSLQSLFIAQKKAIRALGYKNSFYNSNTGELPCHTKEIFNRDKILTVHNLVVKNCLIAMQKIYLNVSPLNIQNLFSKVNENRPRRDPVFFQTPFSRLKSQDKTLEHRGPKLYNSVINIINKNNFCTANHFHVENFYIKRFKNEISNYLLSKQNFGEDEWVDENFVH